MKLVKAVSCSILILSLDSFIFSCEMFSTPINKILENPRDYINKSVRISGRVKEVVGLIVVKYFVVKDKTGEIIVVTKRPLPKEGAEITVKGKVHEAFAIGDKQLLVLVEDEEKQ